MADERARVMRRQGTEAERILWRALRNRSLIGAKFRRQVPLASYIVDFACHAHRLVVEVDGGQHAVRSEEDARRTRALEAAGYRVLRFWNSQVQENLDGVVQIIVAELDR